MPSLKDTKRRIQSVKNTQQTTRAMKMVSAAKLRKAQDAIMNARPYALRLNQLVCRLASLPQTESKYFVKPERHIKKVLVVAMNSDKGLCAAFNSNINKKVFEYYEENKNNYNIDFIFIGRKVRDYFRNRGVEGLYTIENLAKEVSFEKAQNLSIELVNKYENEAYDKIFFIFNDFVNALTQKVEMKCFLPIDPEEAEWNSCQEMGFTDDYIFDDPPEEMLEDLIRKHLEIQVFRYFQESLASEHGARMNAMENATNNAKDVIRTLTLAYNNARQAAITKELIEITSGAEALNS